jgi:SAM-dependent methyltransferase
VGALRPMPADPRIYDNDRVANAYAHTRPPVHARAWQRIAPRLPLTLPVQRALDIGCGAGASTAALAPYARHLTGIDPFDAMVRRAAVALPDATIVRGSAETLPFADGRFQLVCAAGSLNYSDVARSVAEASRVLVAGGCFVPYDFATGNRVPGDASLLERFRAYRERFPAPPGYALDLAALPYAAHGLERLAYEDFDVAVLMTGAAYTDYLMGDAGVEVAIAAGLPAGDAQAFIEAHFKAVFAHAPREVLFNVQVALARKPLQTMR